MIEMMAVSYSLQMYWSTVAHDRATRTHDAQREALRRYEAEGWKSPYQSEADAVDQADRLADGISASSCEVSTINVCVVYCVGPGGRAADALASGIFLNMSEPSLGVARSAD